MISPEGHGWHVAKAIRGLPGGGRQMLLPGSCEDVMGPSLALISSAKKREESIS
jgi:hypothetical protein